MALTLQGVRSLASANFSRGGDYVLEMLSDKEIRERFCKTGGKKALYDYMESVEKMRNYIEGSCVV